MAKAKTKLVNGERINIATGTPYIDANKTGSTISESVNTAQPVQGSNIPDVSRINSNNLATQPSINLTQPGTPVANAGLEGNLNQESELAKARRESAQVTADTDAYRRAQAEELQAYILGQETPAELRSRYGEQQGTQAKEEEVARLESDLAREQRALELKVREIEKNTRGMFGGAVQDEVNRAKSESFQRQADIAIVLNAAQNRLDIARDYVEQKVTAQFERQQLNLDAVKFNYQENKELFTRDEQRSFDKMLRVEQNEIDKQKEEMKTKENIALEVLSNGGSSVLASQVRSAKTVEDAIRLGGSYVGLLDRLNLYSQMAQRAEESNQKTKELNASQAAALGYGNRALEASNIIDGLDDNFAGSEWTFAKAIPYQVKGEDRKKFEQARRNFINAVLRKESGAVIADDEFDNAEKQYFAQPGDTEEVLIQKRNNRIMTIRNLYVEAGQDTSIIDEAINDPLGLGIARESGDPLGINK